MKKIVLSVFTMLLAVLLVACGSKTYYAADGKYLGYEIKGTDLTTVEVTVVNDKITAYYIDVRQGKASVNAEGKGVITWNAKTKKELGNEYGMKDVGPGYKLVDGAWVVDGKSQKEWFEQAALIEAKFLADGIDAATLTEGRFDNIAGVTIKDAYSAAAKKAVENAKNGVFVDLDLTGTNLTTAEVTVKDGKVTKYYLNVLQGSVTVTGEGEEAKATLVWNAKTKKELGDEYGMKDVGPGYKLVDGVWVVDGKSQKEWFEQAALIEAKFLADGIDAATLTDGRFDNIAGVTIKDAYSAVAKAALARWAK